MNLTVRAEDRATIPDSPLDSQSGAQAGVRRQIRGSSLLMSGRLISLGVNFAVQVLIVRHLTQSAYGSFAYALSLVTLGETVVTFGLDRAITRFVPIYDEQRDYARLWGTIVMVFGAVVTFGLGLVLAFWGLQGVFGEMIIGDPQALALLTVLIVLAPIQALDTLFNGLFAVFSKTRAIFFRRYVVGPGLRLLVVGLLIATGSGIEFLAVGYLLSGVVIVLVFGVLLYRFARSQPWFELLAPSTVRVPVRAVLAFTVPLLASDVLHVVMGTVDAIMLAQFTGPVAVAEVRAVLPLAAMNHVVLASFALLYTPVAARMFARQDHEAINDLYWKNAVWTAVVSFPIFALTFSLAQPLTVVLFEERYANSGIILALLSLGYYFDASLGQNGLTLKVLGRTRYVVFVYGTAAALSVVLNLLLIPPFGALGAAIGTSITLVALGLLKQAGLRLGTGIRPLDTRYREVYRTILLGAGALLAVQLAVRPPFAVSCVLAVAASLAVVRLTRHRLDAERMFPEVLRVPGARWIFGSAA